MGERRQRPVDLLVGRATLRTALSPDLLWRRGGASGFGWTLGAGIEYAISNNWTIRAEYLYVDLGNEDSNWSCTRRASGLLPRPQLHGPR